MGEPEKLRSTLESVTRECEHETVEEEKSLGRIPQSRKPRPGLRRHHDYAKLSTIGFPIAVCGMSLFRAGWLEPQMPRGSDWGIVP